MSLALATPPEKFIDRLRDRLALHAVAQATLIVLPPLLASWYAVFFLYRFAWVGADTVLVADAALVVVAGAAAAALSRRRAPSRRLAARLIDEKAEGQDRFMTLATIDPAVCSPALLSRLRAEAASFEYRVEVGKDFPFRVRRSFLNSCVGALVAIMMFHLLFELAPMLTPATRGVGELRLIAERLSKLPGLDKLAEKLKMAAAAFQDSAVSEEEKRALIEQLTKEINRQLAGGGQGSSDGEELLRQAGNQLSGLEEGLDQGKGRGKSAGGSQAETPQQNSGRGNGMKDGGAAEKQSGAMKQPIPAPNLKDQTLPDPSSPGGFQLKEGGEKEGKKAASDDQGAAAGREPKEGIASKTGEQKGDAKGAGSKTGEKIPERFLGAGERGQAAAKDARFVIVELPEEETGPATGRASDEKRKVTGTKLPSANLPLGRPDEPDAAAEKQMLPLEYRGMIR